MAAKKKSGLLPSIEVLIVVVFLMSFIMWAFYQCNERKTQNRPTLETVAEPESVSTDTPTNTANTSSSEHSTANTATNTSTTTNSSTSVASPSTAFSSGMTKLYVSLDQLNVRTHPHLDSTSIKKLPLFEEVYYQEQITDFTQKINLGNGEMADEPWVKVRTKSGHIGWVYGAGVHYFKRRRLGNQSDRGIE